MAGRRKMAKTAQKEQGTNSCTNPRTGKIEHNFNVLGFITFPNPGTKHLEVCLKCQLVVVGSRHQGKLKDYLREAKRRGGKFYLNKQLLQYLRIKISEL